VTADQSLSVRFAGGYQNSESFRDFAVTDRKVFNPSVTWRPTESTTITADVEVSRYNHRSDTGIPVIGNRLARVPISRSFGDPNTPLGFQDRTHFPYQLAHKFNESWFVTNRFLASLLSTEDIWENPTPAFDNAIQADGRTLNRNIFGQTSYTRVYTTNLDLHGKFWLAGTHHKVLLSGDFTHSTSDYATFGDFETPNPALAIDLFNPRYGIDPALFTAARAIGNRASKFRNQWYAMYFQDQVTLWNRLHILGGGRYDWAEGARGDGATFEQAHEGIDSVTRKDSRFSPRVGLLYDVTPWLAVYGNYTTSFGANNGIIANNQPLPPELGKQKEVGLKADLFEHRLHATLAFYHLTKNNVLTSDLTTADPFDVIAVGEQRSRGIEFDMVGRVTDAISVIGSYAYTDTRVTEDNSGLRNNRFPGVPLNSGSLWVKYDFREQPGALKGLSLGFGPYLAGSRHGDIQNTFTLPGYVRLDGFAAYRWTIGPTRAIAQLTVRNLLNQEYYENADQFSNVAPRNGVYPGAPLTFIGSLRLEY
jgi:iron complex outermembrane receptor protein